MEDSNPRGSLAGAGMKLRSLPFALQRRIRTLSGHRVPIRGSKYLVRLSPRIDTELFSGIRIDLNLRDATQLDTYVMGARYEAPTPDVLREWGRTGAGIFFDVGANYGFYSYWMLAECPSIEVYAFEPEFRSYQTIVNTVARNELRRLHPVRVGLADKSGRLELHAGQSDLGHSTFGDHPQLGGVSAGPVQVLPFDEWRVQVNLSLPREPAWIAKIDVEGFEERVLRGMEVALRARAFRGLVVEVNEYTLAFCGSSPASMVEFLTKTGYRQVEIEGAQSPNSFFVPTD